MHICGLQPQVNGTNVLIIPSKNPYTFGLTLLDMFLSREELSMSLLFSSSKSDIDIIVEGLEMPHVSHRRLYFMESTIHALTN